MQSGRGLGGCGRIVLFLIYYLNFAQKDSFNSSRRFQLISIDVITNFISTTCRGMFIAYEINVFCSDAGKCVVAMSGLIHNSRTRQLTIS